jgi:hypothetical protein
VVSFSSPPFNMKLSVCLPYGCNVAPLIAKATTKLKEVTFYQAITQYPILCCYPVSRLGLLTEQRQSVLGRVDRELMGTEENLEVNILDNQHLTLCRILNIYTYPLFPQTLERKNALVTLVQCGTGHSTVRL